MQTEKMQLIVGALLHDIGKVIYRQGDGRKHSISGYEFLSREAHIEEKNVLDPVRFHHKAELQKADVPADSFAYIAYIADNIAAGADRRKNDGEEKGFSKEIPLESVFNILNGNDKKLHYRRGILEDTADKIQVPTDQQEAFDEGFYYKVKQNLLNNFLGIFWEEEYLNSILEILEGNLSLVPSSTARDELADISLYDHVKLTAAAASCIYDDLEEKGIRDYRACLFEKEKEFKQEKTFLLCSMDISGIQKFIYTIHSEGALRNLRARSFYLSIMMEHIIDTLLQRLELSRANLIYSGGGHCYLLLANTKKTKQTVEEFEKELNQWLLENFDIALYVAAGAVECSASELRNEPKGSYSEIFRRLGNMLSQKKSSRYSAGQIRMLNRKRNADHTRECKVCKRLDRLEEDGNCTICSAILGISKDILYSDFFVVLSEEEKGALPLPFHAWMVAENKSGSEARMGQEAYLRAYGKNKMFSGKHISGKLWVGNYTTGETFEELAAQAEGIKRIGILRADVDNLGRAFVSGFESEKNGDKYVTLSRTAALSRQLSMFFQYHINAILAHPKFSLDGKPKKERKAAIVYSGGDDLFLVGAWNEIVELAVDIQRAFREYTEGTLTLSAGIGIYQPGFPIHASAAEVAGLEEDSKSLPGKDAVTFLPDGAWHSETGEDGAECRVNDATYSWKTFQEETLGEKFQAVYAFFQNSEDKGKSFLYHLLELVRKREDKLNLARYVYLLTRMEPGERSSPEEKQRYQEFSRKMYQWMQDEKDCRQLKTAINLYAYYVREEKESRGLSREKEET